MAEVPVVGKAFRGHEVVASVVATLVTIAVIKWVASQYPTVPVLPTVAAHI